MSLTPFGGDHYKLVNFENARLVDSKTAPIYQTEKDRKAGWVPPEIADWPLNAATKP